MHPRLDCGRPLGLNRGTFELKIIRRGHVEGAAGVRRGGGGGGAATARGRKCWVEPRVLGANRAVPGWGLARVLVCVRLVV